MINVHKEKLERLESFKTIENIYPLDIKIIDFVKKVVTALPDEELLKWNIFPSMNGGVALVKRFKENAMLYFTNHNTCIASAYDNKDLISWKFSIYNNIDEVIDVINKINEFFTKYGND